MDTSDLSQAVGAASDLEALRRRLAEYCDLDSVRELAEWDQRVMMPPVGAERRAHAAATLGAVAHRLLVDPETARLIEAAHEEIETGDASEIDPDDVRIVQLARRQRQRAQRVPEEFSEQRVGALVSGQDAWATARAEGRFASLVPGIEANVDRARRYADLVEPVLEDVGCAYDVLLDGYEPGVRAADLDRLFGEIEMGCVELLRAVADAPELDDGPLRLHISIAAQREIVSDVLTRMGVDTQTWRVDESLHPLVTRMYTPTDVRITVRYEEDYWPIGVLSAMHECGHGLYEAGIDPKLSRTPLGSAASLAMHESQSRLWENMVGRGRPFTKVLAPLLRRLGGEPAADLDPAALFTSLNRVSRDPVRTRSDELTYALHIILRTELERALVDGDLKVTDLDEAWRVRFEQLTGVTIDGEAEGPLQDPHWAMGMFGFFPTYLIGNAIAGQLWQRLVHELPGLDDDLAGGELGSLSEWLGAHVWRHGARLSTDDLVRQAVGEPLTARPYLEHMRGRLSDAYGIDLGPSTREGDAPR